MSGQISQADRGKKATQVLSQLLTGGIRGERRVDCLSPQQNGNRPLGFLTEKTLWVRTAVNKSEMSPRGSKLSTVSTVALRRRLNILGHAIRIEGRAKIDGNDIGGRNRQLPLPEWVISSSGVAEKWVVPAKHG